MPGLPPVSVLQEAWLLSWLVPGVEPPFVILPDDVQIAALVRDRRVSVVGFCKTPYGVVPFSHHFAVYYDVPDGPVDISNCHPALIAALDERQETFMAKAKKESVRAAVESLVERARQGDQNAMGTIATVRDEADRGNPRAKKTMKMLKAYIFEHPAAPPGMGAEQGKDRPDPRTRAMLHSLGEGIDSGDPKHYQAAVSMCIPGMRRNMHALDAAGVMLANGPNLLNSGGRANARISALDTQFGAEGPPIRKAFKYGIMRSKYPEVILEAMPMLPKEGVNAMCIGYCLGLAKRLQAVRKGAPVALISSDAAWELGE